MVSVSAQYRLVETLQGGSLSLHNPSNRSVASSSGNSKGSSPAKNGLKGEIPSVSFDRFLEAAVDRYRKP